MTLGELNRATLTRQLLLARAPVGVEAAVAALAGMQAQVPKPPFIGLWSRLTPFARADLAAAISDRRLLRATMMRGTLHLMTRADFLAWRPLLQPVLAAGAAAITKQPIGSPDIDRVVAVGRDFFARRPAPFEALREHLQGLFPGAPERLLAYTVRMHLPLAMVPDDSTWSYPPDAAFAVAETFLAAALAGDPDPRELVRRYLAAFGPAGAADFQTWSGLGNARGLFVELRDELLEVADARGRVLYDLPTSPRPAADVPAPVRFLPEFDNLLLAHADRSRVIADEHRSRVATKNLRILATFLVDGFVAGTWTSDRKRKLATLRLVPFNRLAPAATDALVAEGEGLLRFLEPDAPAVAVEIAAES
jgi:hypothetical protein